MSHDNYQTLIEGIEKSIRLYHPDLLKLIFSQYIIKILFEIAFVPPTYIIVNFLKQNEYLDFSKKYANFDPITLEKFVINEK